MNLTKTFLFLSGLAILFFAVFAFQNNIAEACDPGTTGLWWGWNGEADCQCYGGVSGNTSFNPFPSDTCTTECRNRSDNPNNDQILAEAACLNNVCIPQGWMLISATITDYPACVSCWLTWPSNIPPNKPTNISPANGSTPTLDANGHITLQGSVYSESEGEAHKKTHWQLGSSPGCSGPYYIDKERDSGSDSDLTNIYTGEFDLGLSPLAPGLTLYWRVRYSDGCIAAGIDWSEWSDCTSFTPQVPCASDGNACLTDSSCCSGNCVLDYDGSPKICVPNDRCQHDGDYTPLGTYRIGKTLNNNLCVDCRDNTTRWLYTNPGRFIVKKKGGTNKLILDKNGQLLLAGSKSSWASPNGGDWLVKSAGAVKAWLDDVFGNLYLSGGSLAEQQTISPGAGSELLIKTKTPSTYVGKIDASGNMQIKGQLGEGCILP